MVDLAYCVVWFLTSIYGYIIERYLRKDDKIVFALQNSF